MIADQAETPGGSEAAAVAKVAPTSPPTSAWVDEEGSPNHQVSRFQIIAPSSAQTIVALFTNCPSTNPEEIVFATATPTRAPTRFVMAAIPMARRGLSTLVETTVAIEFAVSWKPLMYSKTSATRTTMKTSVMRRALGVLQHDVQNDVANVAATIRRFLQQIVELLPIDQEPGVLLAVIKLTEMLQQPFVRIAFHALQALPRVADFCERRSFPQSADQLDDDVASVL